MSRIGSSSSQQIFGPQGTLRSATEGTCANLQPTTMITTTTTTTTTIWQWQCTSCGAPCKMVRQVTTTCPHACDCWCRHGPSVGNPLRLRPPSHNQQHRHEDDIFAWADEANTQLIIPGSDPAPPVSQFWARDGPDPYLMVQQLREFESLGDQVVALRMQLELYKDEIEKSKKENAGRNWFLPLPANIRNVLVMARGAIDYLIRISTPPSD